MSSICSSNSNRYVHHSPTESVITWYNIRRLERIAPHDYACSSVDGNTRFIRLRDTLAQREHQRENAIREVSLDVLSL